MRGDRKRKKSMFKPGQVPSNKGQILNYSPRAPRSHTGTATCTRMTAKEYRDNVEEKRDGTLNVEDVDGNPCELRILRPKPDAPTHIERLSEKQPGVRLPPGYRIVRMNKVEEMWQEATAEHLKLKPKCTGKLQFDEEAEVKWGLGWQEGIKCSKCNYTSERKKLYNEVDSGRPGRKAADLNVGANVGLTHTPIGPTGLRSILHSVNIPAPAASGFQKQANQVNAALEDLNKKDMKARREKLKDQNELKGLPRDAPIRAEGDGRYNNPLFTAAGKTPFQPSSQATYSINENQTKSKDIIAIQTANKLCQTGALKAKKTGEVQQCKTDKPAHSGSCSANIAAHKSIGDEYQYASDLIEDLLGDDIKIKYFTTDSDSRASKAANEVYKKYGIDLTTIPLKDTQHLGRGQRSKIISTNFTSDMFEGRRTADKSKAKTRFADDVTVRCAAEHAAAYKIHRDDREKLKTELGKSMEAILKCYQDDHSECEEKSFVCGENNRWKKPFMKKDTKINCTGKDELSFRECLNYRLGNDALDSTRFHTNTQKTESVNRIYSAKNPKNNTFSRNFPGRIHSAAFQANNGHAASMSLQLQGVGAPITPGGAVSGQLKAIEKRQSYMKEYKKSPEAKSRRYELRVNKYKLYDSKSSEKTKIDYKKQLMDDESADKVKEMNTRCLSEHSYAKKQ